MVEGLFDVLDDLVGLLGDGGEGVSLVVCGGGVAAEVDVVSCLYGGAEG